ncbi:MULTISPECIES: winged helix-turn-helix transcriptional regulator [unclassified Kitasatospora]|uniref:winged helix-turn-helix transcriptional regulator n=1 Tax=unclassified Kitasatospora TaxID=2633591 RepID=UPI00070CFF34|nr:MULTISPECIES: winged helix-turn-helix transcriptional regulator [unclassified Kitasatospora]KQV20925.1 hypothetical protein ASC99_20695 [Kitasatospora sp. Root107]KRB60421.1 hypothetical protein ASE03_12485 [Kitasatospora sp. Root187]
MALSTLSQAQRIQNALSILGPQDTVSILRLLKSADGTLPKSLLEAQSRWMSESQVDNRLDAMEEDGLITRKREDSSTLISLTRAGREALYVQIPVTRWSSAHQGVPEHGTGQGAYTEQALATLNKAHTAATIMALAAYGEPAYPSEILEDALPKDMNPGNLYQRLAQMEKAGLVRRTGEPRNYMYGLTAAGKALAEPLEAIGRWSQRHLPKSRAEATTRRASTSSATLVAPAPRPTVVMPTPVAQSRTAPPARSAPAQVAPAADGTSPSERAALRSNAAGLRSATTALSFSHDPIPQPAPLFANSTATQRR